MTQNIESLVNNFIPFLSSPLGILGFALVYVFWVSCLLPGSWLSMLSGFLYGTWLGSSVVFVGAFVGAHLTFFKRMGSKQGLEFSKSSNYGEGC
jgi:uncharacterized membrane protein YdjX (TVP38/TMEM64 family)